MYALQLERAGYAVMSTRDGEAALRAARTFQPSAIVIEVRLAGLDGMDTLRRLKEDPSTSSIPVIVLTASVFQLTEGEVKAAGAAALLWKPYYPADLLTALQQFNRAPDTNATT